MVTSASRHETRTLLVLMVGLWVILHSDSVAACVQPLSLDVSIETSVTSSPPEAKGIGRVVLHDVALRICELPIIATANVYQDADVLNTAYGTATGEVQVTVSGTASFGHCYSSAMNAQSGSLFDNASGNTDCLYGPPNPGDIIKCHTCGGNPEPLTLDLNGDGLVSTSGLDRPVYFDIDADGAKEWITWVDGAAGDGFLWLDVNANHQVDGGFELFGVGMILPWGERASDGFEALSVYDRTAFGGNGDGRITSADAIWGRLRIWVDGNADGLAQHDREIFTIAQRSVREIDLRFVAGDQVDQNGNNHFFRSTFAQSHAGLESSRPIHGLIFQIVAP